MDPARRFHVEIRRLVAGLGPTLTISERQEVLHFLDHGEPVEALRTLAWVLSDKQARVNPETLAEWRRLAQDSIQPKHLPPEFS